MQLKALYLRNYRNYRKAIVEFSSGINHIYGKNAQGKTNLLEAIHFLVTGRSFRTHHLKDLILEGEKEFYLEAYFQKNEVEQSLKISCDGKQRKIIHNHTLIPSLSGLLGIFLGVVLSPEDSHLVKGEPALRRQFLDIHIAQGNPLFVYHLSRYLKAMKHRNALLKNKSQKGIEIWEQEMANSGAYIALQRLLATQNLEQESQPLQNTISSSFDRLSLEYKSPSRYYTQETLKDYYISQYQKTRIKELEIGSTLVGPHKDDLLITLAEKEARHFASEGQQRSLVASLRLAQWQHLKKITEESPLMCIDDLGISLDMNREELLYTQLKHLGQVFVTSPKKVPFDSLQAHAIQVDSGTFL